MLGRRFVWAESKRVQSQESFLQAEGSPKEEEIWSHKDTHVHGGETTNRRHKAGHLQAKERGPGRSQHHDLGPPASEPRGNEFPLFKPRGQCYLLQQPWEAMQMPERQLLLPCPKRNQGSPPPDLLLPHPWPGDGQQNAESSLTAVFLKA